MKRALAGMAIVVSVCAAGANSAHAEPVDDAVQVLRAALGEGVGGLGYPGAIGLIRRGDQVRRVGVGVGDLVAGTAADPGAPVRIGSITKMFVATVLLQLIGEGKVGLDDTVERWLPGVVRGNGHAGERIRVRHLLENTSGLVSYDRDPVFSALYAADVDPARVWEPRELVQISTASPPYADPGVKQVYSNTDFVLAAMVIEAATGRSAEAEIQSRIVTPLGLRHTFFPRSPEAGPDWMRGYFLVRDVSISNPTIHGAAGAMVSTLDDLAVFAGAQQDGRLLAPAQLSLLRSTFHEQGRDTGFAMGIYRWDSPCGPVWLKYGAVLGYFSAVATSDSGDKQVVLAANEYHLLSDSPSVLHLAAALERVFCTF
ncbi:serine hydrolase domain-containing protein [Nocardia sp. NPDC052001]|uniref:serine hydrolase domain-containing protein n=1 Tax=Nocardia sp. NPDC052001 TaxID=3154853 RepID=UPI00342F9610